jgi:hypothetical protein
MDPSEVSRLSLRWLDGVATDVERERLFEVIAADASAALVFAQHARFEQLLASASHDRARQAVVMAATKRQQTRQQRQQMLWRGLKAAAVLLFVGPVIWFAWPRPEPERAVLRQPAPRPSLRAQPGKAAPAAVAITKPKPPEPSATLPTAEPPTVPLAQRLTSFYLPPMKFEQVTLAEALRQIEAQMKAINQNTDHDLARLLLQMPASAAQQKISFDSPGMGVLPLVQAIAGLAGCEASLASDSPRLVLNLSNPQIQRQTRTFSTFTSEEELANADQLARDARAVGIDTSSWQVNDKGQRLPPAQITASAGQLKALDALSGARAALSQIPPVRVRALVVPRPPGTENRELTIKERDDYLARGDLTPSATFELKPGTRGVSLSPQKPPASQAPAQLIVHSQDTPLHLTNSEPQLAMNTPSAPVFTLRSMPMGNGQALLVNASPRTASTTGSYANAESSTKFSTGSNTVPDTNLSLQGAVTAGNSASADLIITNITMNHSTAPMMLWNRGSNHYAGAVLSLGGGSSLVILPTP